MKGQARRSIMFGVMRLDLVKQVISHQGFARSAQTCVLSVLVALWLLAMSMSMPAVAIGDLGWSAGTTRMLVVGVLKWKSTDLESFSTKNRRDRKLVNFFLKAGVPQEKICYLANQNATLQGVMAAVKEQAAAAGPGETLIFYYCGHGWLDDDNKYGYLANYDAGDTNESWLSVNEIVQQLRKNFKGDQLIVLADCCCSGALAEAMKAANPSFKYAVLTSAVASQTSTENWTFSQALLDTLNGHSFADSNKDGAVTFAELGAYIKHEMKQLEEQDATFDSGGGFDRNFVVANVKNPGEPVPENVEVKFEGDWWKAKLLKVEDGMAKVHWLEIGWDTANDESVVPISDVRKLSPVKDAKRAGAAAAPKPTSSSPKNAGAATLVSGTKVKVSYEGDYYPATILKVNEGKYLIHYEGYQASDDEWVDRSRIK